MKILRKLLFPFSILYYLITSLRNLFYNNGILKSQSYEKPIIVVGNLNTGGTGKSPMTIFLIETLHTLSRVAVLSRGYKRKTKGYIELTTEHTAEEVGDEPLQFKTNYPDLFIAVCADRRYGISKLLDKADLILLDDAFQHRKVKGSYYILLTSYGDLFVQDYLLPMGNLREARRGAKRANCIVVTKCPKNLSWIEQKAIVQRLEKYASCPIYFSSIAYADFICNVSLKLPIANLRDKTFTLVTGIANPRPLIEHLDALGLVYKHLEYPDHHLFTRKEILELQEQDCILTTEKDFMRLKDELDAEKLYYLPIKTVLQEEQSFIDGVLQHIKSYS